MQDMTRRCLAAYVALLSSAIGGCGLSDERPRAPAPGAATVRVHVRGGVSVDRPGGWHLTPPPITAVSVPAERLLLTSYPTRRGGNCGPDRAEHDLPAGGALVYLFEYRSRTQPTWTHLRRRAFPPRPAHFALRARQLGTFECWRVPSYLIRFRAAGRAVPVHVALGRSAGAARRAQVLRVLDSLRVSKPAAPGTRRTYTATELAAALRTNPNDEAASADCRTATARDRRRARRTFGRTRLPLFVCAIALRREPAETFDVQVLRNGCFVAERRRGTRGDFGCIRR
jgi:hypothetical protein